MNRRLLVVAAVLITTLLVVLLLSGDKISKAYWDWSDWVKGWR